MGTLGKKIRGVVGTGRERDTKAPKGWQFLVTHQPSACREGRSGRKMILSADRCVANPAFLQFYREEIARTIPHRRNQLVCVSKVDLERLSSYRLA